MTTTITVTNQQVQLLDSLLSAVAAAGTAFEQQVLEDGSDVWGEWPDDEIARAYKQAALAQTILDQLHPTNH